MTARAAALLVAACAGCGMLESPASAAIDRTGKLEDAPPAIDLGGGRTLQLTRLRFDPPRLAPDEGGAVRVDAVLWAEGALAGAKLVFHGSDRLMLHRPSAFARWELRPEFPHLRSVAAALAGRKPPDAVAVWQVGLNDLTEAQVREGYVKDASGRPVRAASSFALRRASAGAPWSVSIR